VRQLTPTFGTGLALAAAAGLMLLARLPGAFNEFDHAAHAARGRNQLGGALATADSLELDDAFVRSAMALVPKGGRFVVVLPRNEAAIERSDGVSPITFDGVPALFEDYLLPRVRLETASPGTYILCFYCSPVWNERAHWLTSEEGGGRVGYIYR
jgi:hypothetical protein